VFPASQLSVDPRSGIRRRHHLHESVLQKGVKEAVKRAGLHKPIVCHSLRQAST
jgi:integrase